MTDAERATAEAIAAWLEREADELDGIAASRAVHDVARPRLRFAAQAIRRRALLIRAGVWLPKAPADG